MPAIPTQMWPTVERFAASLGLTAAPRADGSAAFVFETAGTLTFTPTLDGARCVMTLARAVDLAPEQVLAGGGYEPTLDVIVHPGLTRTGVPALSIVYEPADFEVSRVAVHFDALRRALGAR